MKFTNDDSSKLDKRQEKYKKLQPHMREDRSFKGGISELSKRQSKQVQSGINKIEEN